MVAAGMERWESLQRFARARRVIEQCELCSLEIPAEHQHLVESASRKLVCACEACAILFGHQTGGKYRRVPRDSRYLPGFRLTDLQWNALAIPIGLAFFVHSTPHGRVIAIYPSPAGPTESLFDLEAWEELVQENPVLQNLQPDAEALLVNRIKSARDHYLAPIDVCYKLVGLLRMHWRGLSGGPEVWQEIEQFFAVLQRRSQR